MDGTTMVTRQPGMIEADAGGELVGLHVDHGACYGFNATATRVWQLLQTPQTIDALTETLMVEHEVDQTECREGLAELLAMLESEKLVRLDPA